MAVLADKERLFTEAMRYFYQQGIKNITEPKLIDLFQLPADSFPVYFKDKEDFLRQAVEYDLEIQITLEAEILKIAVNPVEEILLMLRHYVRQIAAIHPGYFIQIQYLYPLVWKAYTRHAQMHGYYQFYDLINRGIQQQYFRRDINLEIVTKVLIEQINVMHNTHLFPKHRYEMDEVFRSIFLYYLKGITTEKGQVIADKFFSQGIFIIK